MKELPIQEKILEVGGGLRGVRLFRNLVANAWVGKLVSYESARPSHKSWRSRSSVRRVCATKKGRRSSSRR